MKQLSYFVALAALLMFASCQKEDTPIESSVKEDPVFTATIANDETKTSLDLSTKKVSWTMYDEITITDSETTPNTVKYEVTAIDGTTGKATFTKKSDETGTLGAGPYTATYGEALSTSQTYSAEVTDLPMSAISETTSLTFIVSCGLLKVTLSQTGISISSIAVSNGTDTYTLTCSDAVSIASGATFYITVPAGTYTSFKFTESNGYVSWRSPLSISVAANHIKPVSSNFGPEYKENETLYGYGSKINGYWWAPVNCGYDATHTCGSLYQWGRKYGQPYEDGALSLTDMAKSDDTAENSGKFGKYDSSTYNWFSGTVDNTLWNGSSKGASDPCPTGWRVPTYDELNALTGNNGSTSIGVGGWDSADEGYWFNGTTSPVKENGLFLPAAGFRDCSDGNAINRGSYGSYWSSSVNGNRGRLLRLSSSLATMHSGNRASGYSVRCVQE